ncbi:MAG: tetratricopeptide repeat protein [Flavobacteriales bacterium]
MMRTLLLALFLLFGLSIQSAAQLAVRDSVGKILKSNQKDTLKIIELDNYAWSLIHNMPDSALYVAGKAMELATELSYNKQKSSAIISDKYVASILVTLGSVYYLRSDYNTALHQFHRALKIREAQSDEKGMASILNNIGLVLVAEGDYLKALDCYFRGLDIKIAHNDLKGQAYFFNNIGNIYENLNDYTSAKDYFSRALEIAEELNDKYGQASSLTNIGLVYKNIKDYDSAHHCFTKAVNLFTELNDGFGLSKALNNLGQVLRHQGDIDGAYNVFTQSLIIKENLNDVLGMSGTLISLGEILLQKKRIQESLTHCKEAFDLAHLTRSLVNKRDACKCLSKAYETVNKPDLALIYFQRFTKYKDSLSSTDRTQDILRKEMDYKLEKARLSDSIQRQELEKISQLEKLQTQMQHDKNLSRQRLILSIVAVGLILAAVFSFFLYKRVKLTEEQKKIIEEQKQLVEEKNKDITDSIRYAQHIQTAILPPAAKVELCLPESFVLYRPRDIISGDFYWLEKIENQIIVAAVDCTGHGVPGALVSIVGNNGLNRTVKEFGLTTPAEILDKLDELVNESFRQSSSNEFIRDGMDIALCNITPLNNSKPKKYKVQYSGANNPLWVFKKNHNGSVDQNGPYSFLEFKPDKQPIGQYSIDEPNEPFSLHEVLLNEGDVFYIFSDGYADQFGGPKGKKFKYSQLRQLLLSIIHLPMNKQHQILDEKFDEWKGELEQVDDVCMIGIRL